MGIAWKYTPPVADARVLLAAAAPIATRAAADHLLAVSEPLVPEDTGALKASGQVTQEGTKATVSYSAVAPDGYDYAAIQHERLDYHHEHGQAKYLEQPMNSEAHAILGIVGETLAREIGR